MRTEDETKTIRDMLYVLPINIGGITMEDLIDIFDFKDEIK